MHDWYISASLDVIVFTDGATLLAFKMTPTSVLSVKITNTLVAEKTTSKHNYAEK